MGRFSGKVAIVTGGGKGIGRKISERLAEEGAAVAINYSKSAKESEAVVAAIEAKGGKAMAMQADMANVKEIRAFFAAVDKRFGRLDMLVNNAGTTERFGTDRSFETLTEEQFDIVFDVNCKGVLFASQEAARRLPPGGSIVMIVSSSGDFPVAKLTLYTASKTVPRAFTSIWAKELGPRGIRVNAVSSGPVDVGMTEGASETVMNYLKTPIRLNATDAARKLRASSPFS